MNLSIGLSLTRPSNPLGAPAFSPASLFASGEEGAWYDPSDLTTLYQDAAGTTPAGVGDPVGLMLDKSKGLTLGSELITNGTFDTDVSGWTPINSTIAWENGAAKLTSTVANQIRVAQSFTTVVGKTYKATATVWQGTTTVGMSLLIPGVAGSATVFSATPTEVSVIFTATSTSTAVRPGTSSATPIGETCFVDNVSVRELPGNHATQSTPTARPTLQTSGGLYYLDFDGGDDWLRTTFSANQAQPNTIAAAFKFDQGARLEFLVDGVGSARNTIYKVSTQLALFAGLGITDPTAAGTSERVVLGHLNTTSSDMRLDGSSVITGSVGNNQWGGITLGATSSGSSWLDGRIYGFVGVNRTLTAGEIDDVEAYLAAKSGVTL